MSLRRWPRSVRARLALWHGLALLAVVSVYAAAVLRQVRADLYEELDRHLEGDIAWAESVLAAQQNGQLATLPEEGRTAGAAGGGASAAERGRELPWVEAWTPDGRLLFVSGRPAGAPASSAPRPGRYGRPQSLRVGHGRFRARIERVEVAGRPLVLRVARSEGPAHEELWEFGTALGASLPLAFAVAAGAGYFLARRALAPVGAMAARAREITADHLNDRLPVDDPDDEFGQLATVFNGALARIEHAFAALRRFTADASHELRTPLTAIRSVGEVGLRGSHESAEYREVIGSILEEADRLSSLVESLLTLSRADAGRLDLHPESFDLAGLARDVADDLGVLSEERRQTVRVEGAAPVLVTADRATIRQAVVNLLDNAIKYSPDDGTIRIAVASSPAEATLDVIDAGPGVPEASRGRIFERFYRADAARSRTAGGVGLGLAIARSAVEANGGRLVLESSSAHGSVFRIRLPHAPES